MSGHSMVILEFILLPLILYLMAAKWLSFIHSAREHLLPLRTYSRKYFASESNKSLWSKYFDE